MLVILGYAPIFVHASNVSGDRALLVVVAVLFLLTFTRRTLGGRRLVKTNRTGSAKRP